MAQKIDVGWGCEIADGATEKKHKEALAGTAAGSNLPKAVQIFALNANNMNEVHIGQLALANRQGRRRDFDGEIIRIAAAGQGFQNPASLFPRSAP